MTQKRSVFHHSDIHPQQLLASCLCKHVIFFVYCPVLTPLYLTPSDADELHISNVTSSSLKLRWSSLNPKLFVYFEVVVTRLHDHSLVLKTNVSGTELSVDNLESAQTYHAVVTAHTAEGQIVSTRKGIMTTSKSINTPPQICCKHPFYPTRWHMMWYDEHTDTFSSFPFSSFKVS